MAIHNQIIIANKSNYTDPNRNTNPNWHSNCNILSALRWHT